MSDEQDPEIEPAPAAETRVDFRPAWRYQWAAIAGVALACVGASAVHTAGRLYAYEDVARYGVIALLALAAYLVLLTLYRRYAWLYSIEGEHIESRHGLIARRVRAVRIRDLRNINVRQSLVQRLLDVGEIEFSSAAGDRIEVVFFGVPDPMGFMEHVQTLQRDRGRGE
jgi:uncharacterized membrane protein YdbT with pleckstrin-like domain